jgi:hypothetical protein
MELILKEKDFRASLSFIDWTQFEDKIVGIFCSTDAIIPMWANMLIVANLSPYVKAVYFGDENKTRELVLLEAIQNIDVASYIDQRVVVKGCGDTPIGEIIRKGFILRLVYDFFSSGAKAPSPLK